MKWDKVDWFLLLALGWIYFVLRKWIRRPKDAKIQAKA